MPRRISTSITGGPTLGTFTAQGNVLQTIVADDDILLDPNGTGQVKSNSAIMLNANNQLRLADADSSNYVALAVPSTVSNNVTYTLPASGVTNGYYLQTNASGVLSWAQSVSITDSTTSASTFYPSLMSAISGSTSGVTVSSTKLTFVPSTGTLTATAFSGNLTSTSVTVSGGTINNTSIGATTRSSGAFTTLAANGDVTITSTTASTSVDSGALQVDGGVGINGALYVGGALSVAGGASGLFGASIITGATTLADVDRPYLIIASSSFTVNLPATSTDGRFILIYDGGNFNQNNITFGRNGANIGGAAENLVANVSVPFALIYRAGNWNVEV